MRHSTLISNHHTAALQPLPCRRHGFTLVELLMVISIIAVLGLMAAGLLRSVRRDADVARTESVIARCKAVLQAKLESFEMRTLPFRFADVMGNDGNNLQKQALRNRMMVEWVMAEMPTCYEQIESFPSQMSTLYSGNSPSPGHSLAPNPIEHPEYWPDAWKANFITQLNLRSPFVNNNLRQKLNPAASGDTFNDRIMNPQSFYNYPTLGRRDVLFSIEGAFSRAKTLGSDERNSLTEGAECLYAILSTSWDGDRRGTHFLSTADVGDTDGDGRLEVLDSFGDPLFFSIRRSVQSSADLKGRDTGPDVVIDQYDQIDVNENNIDINGRDSMGQLVFVYPPGPVTIDDYISIYSDIILNPNKPVEIGDIIIEIRSINQ